MERHGTAEITALEEFCAWQGCELEATETYLGRLDSAAIDELLSTLPALRAQPVSRFRRAHVPLGRLTARLAQWRDAVVYGRGFVLIRRLPIERMKEHDIALAFAALAAHLGQALPEAGGVCELRGNDLEAPLSSGTDDLTALLCLNEPPAGFALRLASAVAVHNAMVHEAPAQLAALYGPAPTRNAPPVFARAGHQLFATLKPEAATETNRHGRALAQALARAEANALRLDFEPGDILFVNNHHALLGMSRQAPASLFEADGRLLRICLQSRLVGKRPADADGHAAWPVETAASQAA